MLKRVFIIGITGRVAKRHIKAWEELGYEVTGCGSDKDYVKEMSKDRYDVVDICTPIYLHASMIASCVNLGYPVICEKPIAINMNEANQVLGFKGKIGVIYQFRFNPKILKLRKELREGKYGDIKMVTANYFRWRDWAYYNKWEADKVKSGGGVLLNVCIHYVDLMQWLFGYPTDVSGVYTTAKTGLDIEDNLSAIMKFPTGAIGSINLSTHVNPPKHFELSVYGTKGHTTIQLRQNEYHKENFKAFMEDGDYVKPLEAVKSLAICETIYNGKR